MQCHKVIVLSKLRSALLATYLKAGPQKWEAAMEEIQASKREGRRLMEILCPIDSLTCSVGDGERAQTRCDPSTEEYQEVPQRVNGCGSADMSQFTRAEARAILKDYQTQGFLPCCNAHDEVSWRCKLNSCYNMAARIYELVRECGCEAYSQAQKNGCKCKPKRTRCAAFARALYEDGLCY